MTIFSYVVSSFMEKKISPLTERGVCDNPENIQKTLMLKFGLLSGPKWQILQTRGHQKSGSRSVSYNIMRRGDTVWLLCSFLHGQLKDLPRRFFQLSDNMTDTCGGVCCTEHVLKEACQ